MSFDPQSVTRIVHMARAEGIDPAALLAVAQVESAGRLFENDGITPRFLFERHVFYRALYKQQRGKLKAAVDQGLAIPKWNRTTQYKDQGSSAGRMASLAAARAIDEECANQSCSWGLGQVLGENAKSLGYLSATDMVNGFTVGGAPAQVESMLRFVKKNNLKDKLNLRDWAGFASRYNGPGYAANRYDVKMAAAYVQWAAKLDAMVIVAPVPMPAPRPVDAPLPPPEAPAAHEQGTPVQEGPLVPIVPVVPVPVPDPVIDELPPPYIEPVTEQVKDSSSWGTGVQMITSTVIAITTAVGAVFESIKPVISDPVFLTILFALGIGAGGFVLYKRREKISQGLG
jgi:hypothetical protein